MTKKTTMFLTGIAWVVIYYIVAWINLEEALVAMLIGNLWLIASLQEK